MARRLAPGARRLPPARTPEQDALALFDEGGVIVVHPHDDPARVETAGNVIVFGHAIYESLVLGVAPAVVAGVSLEATLTTCDTPSVLRPDRQLDALRIIDRALAAALDDDALLRSPRELKRLEIPAADEIP
jgi:hypothetical protein